MRGNLATVADLIEDLADRALLGEVTQLDSEVLLQRLVAALGLALQSGVHVLGDIADQDMRHACIMLTSVDQCKEMPSCPVAMNLHDDRRRVDPELTRDARLRAAVDGR